MAIDEIEELVNITMSQDQRHVLERIDRWQRLLLDASVPDEEAHAVLVEVLLLRDLEGNIK